MTLSDQDRAERDSLVTRFERDWINGPRPTLDAFLPPAEPLRRAVLIELAHIDLECRWKAGDPVPASAYLSRFPELAADPEQARSLRATERDHARRSPHLVRQLEARLGHPLWIGRYAVTCVLGEGGFGVVYRGEDDDLKRVVALKVLRGGAFVSADLRHRFRSEAETVARLRHPNVVQIHEIGEHDGHPFLALEFAEGGSLEGWLRTGPVPARQAARLLEPVARAVHLAHEQGIVHRDLKPANILLTGATDPADPDGRATPKLTDFGLARLLDADQRYTPTGAVMGTPAYMAPEQAAGRSDIGPPADVYALGAVLYQTMTGRPPFLAETPSQTLVQVLSHDPAAPRLLNPGADRDLETISLKCLQKEPRHRYASARAVADDLRRFLEGSPILARPVGSWERGLKWTRRHPAAAGLLAVSGLVVVLAAGLLVGLYYQRQLEGALRTATEARDEADGQRARAGRFRYIADMQLAHRAWLANNPSLARRLLAVHAGGADAGFEWHYLNGLVHNEILGLQAHPGGVFAVAASPNGRYLASAGNDHVIFLWDATTGQLIRSLPGHTESVNDLAFSPDGLRLASASYDRTACVWEVETGRRVGEPLRHPEGVSSVAFSPDGRRLATGCENVARVWDAAADHEVLALSAGDISVVHGVAFDPGGGRLAACGQGQRGGAATVWNLNDKTEVCSLVSGAAVQSLAFSPDGKRLALGGLSRDQEGVLSLWDVAEGRAEWAYQGHHQEVTAVAFSPDGQTLASGARDRTVRLWNARPSPLARRIDGLVYRGLTWEVSDLCFSPDGRRVIAGGGNLLASRPQDNGEVMAWDVTRDQDLFALPENGGTVSGIAFSPDGTKIATASIEKRVGIWDAGTGDLVLQLEGASEWVRDVVFSPDGRRVAAGSNDDAVRVWDGETGELLTTLRGHDADVHAVVFSPDGRALLSGSADGTLKVWDAASGALIRTLSAGHGELTGVAVNADGSRVAAACEDGAVLVWDARAWGDATVLKGHAAAVSGVAFAPDGRRLASGGRDRTVKVWDAQTGQELLALEGHNLPVTCVGFSPDGRRLASGEESLFYDPDAPPEIQVWDLATGEAVLSLRAPTESINRLAFDPTGAVLAGGGDNGAVLLWETAEPGRAEQRREQRGVAWHRRLARWAEGGEDWLAAAAHLRPLVEAEPADVPLRSRHARALAGRNDWPAATAELAEATRLTPENRRLEWHRDEADTACELRDWFAVAFHGERVLAQAPDEADWYWLLGRAHAEVGGWEKAATAFSQAVKSEPDDPTALYYHALARLGGGDVEGYRRGLGVMWEKFLDGEDAKARHSAVMLGTLAPGKARNADALVRAAQRCRKEQPDNPWGLATLGAALYRAGRFEEAVAPLTTLKEMRTNEDTITVELFLAMTYQRRGDHDKALASLKEAAELLEAATGPGTFPAIVTPADEANRARSNHWVQRLVWRELRREAEDVVVPRPQP